MGLKNYTTTISIEKTISEIEKILAINGASHIFKMYDDKGVPSALAFKIKVDGERYIDFKLPMESEKIFEVFKKSKIEKRYKNIEQAKRTGWRIIKDWIYAQMALIEIHVVKFEQVFLPYMYDIKTDQTLFQKYEERNFDFALEDKRSH